MRSAVLAIFSILLLSGCSLFGIATKGELKDMERTQEAERASLRQVVGDLNAQLTQLGQEIDGVLAAMEAARRDQEDLRNELAGFEGSLDAVSVQADAAHQKSQRALRAHLERLLDERARLERHLIELDRQIQGWQRPTEPVDAVPDTRREELLP